MLEEAIRDLTVAITRLADKISAGAVAIDAPAKKESKTVKGKAKPVDPEPITPPGEPDTEAKPAETPEEPSQPKEAVATLDDVKNAIIKLAGTKGRDPVVAILKKYNADKATDVAEDDYVAIVADLEAGLK